MIRSRRKRKFSLFTLVLVAVSICTIIYLPLSTIWDFEEKIDAYVVKREQRLNQYFQMSHALYKSGDDQALTNILRLARDQGDISYFVVYQQGIPTYDYSDARNRDLAIGNTFAQRAPNAGKDLIDNVRSERSEFLSNDVMITMGIDKRKRNLIWRAIFETDVWFILIQDILTVIGFSALAFWLHTRDLTKLKREIAKSGRVGSTLANTKPLSAETEAIVAGFQGYVSSEKELKDKHDRLSAQVLPALKRELFSGQHPPYTFECTLVRTDINGFSQIFNSPYRDRFAEHINDFFVGLTETVSRYDGLIYEFVGDEAIFYFKDIVTADIRYDSQIGPSTSINRAIDAIRDIHLLAKDIGTRTELEGHRFTVKSALAHGTLRFGAQVDGFSLSGGVLIETVRILSTVTAKNENHLYFASRHTPFLRDDMITERVGNFSLKGYSEDVSLVRWVESTPLTHHIAHVTSSANTSSSFDFVSHYRSDFSLENLISAAASAGDKWRLADHLALQHSLRAITVFKAHRPLAATLADWISTMRNLAEENEDWHRAVSAILMIYPNLVPKSAITPEDIHYLENLLDSPDPRTVANTIDALTRYQIEPKVRPLKELFASDNNRVAANALINEGTRALDENITTKLEKMIFGRGIDNMRRASGLYALGEIARILKARDPVYFSTRVDLHRLIDRVDRFTDHDDDSVREQAKRAQAKAALHSDQDAA